MKQKSNDSYIPQAYKRSGNDVLFLFEMTINKSTFIQSAVKK